MAEINIKIRDLDNGGVEMKCEPSFETIMKMLDSGTLENLTPAHGYLFACVNVIRELSKNKDENMIIKVPKLGRL
jgi:hypothetical protein